MQLAEARHVVVDPLEQHGLVAHGDAAGEQPVDGLGGLVGDLPGVVALGVDPDGHAVAPAQDLHQLGGDAMGQGDGGAGVEADHLQVGDGPELLDEVGDLAVGEDEGVAAGEQDVADLRVLAQPLQALLDVEAEAEPPHDHQLLAEAVAAVHGAHVRDQEGHAVLVLTGDAVGPLLVGEAVLLPVQVVLDPVAVLLLLEGGDDLPADGAGRVVGIHEGGEVGRGAPAAAGLHRLDRLSLLVGDPDVGLQLLQGVHALLELMPPGFHARLSVLIRCIHGAGGVVSSGGRGSCSFPGGASSEPGPRRRADTHPPSPGKNDGPIVAKRPRGVTGAGGGGERRKCRRTSDVVYSSQQAIGLWKVLSLLREILQNRAYLWRIRDDAQDSAKQARGGGLSRSQLPQPSTCSSLHLPSVRGAPRFHRAPLASSNGRPRPG